MRGIHRSLVNSPKKPVTMSGDVFFDLRLNERLGKQSWDWWFETPSRPLLRHSNGTGRWLTNRLSYRAKTWTRCPYDERPFSSLHAWVGSPNGAGDICCIPLSVHCYGEVISKQKESWPPLVRSGVHIIYITIIVWALGNLSCSESDILRCTAFMWHQVCVVIGHTFHRSP